MTEGYRESCSLCRLTRDGEILTRLVFEDAMVVVTDCLICGVPMAVLRVHRHSFSPDERNHIRALFRRLTFGRNIYQIAPQAPVGRLFGPGWNEGDVEWVIDWEQRQIPDHAHCHLRPTAFPGTKLWEKLHPDLK